VNIDTGSDVTDRCRSCCRWGPTSVLMIPPVEVVAPEK
jgi:hypothetical protein